MGDIPVESLQLKRLLALFRDPLSSEDLQERVLKELRERGLDLQKLGIPSVEPVVGENPLEGGQQLENRHSTISGPPIRTVPAVPVVGSRDLGDALDGGRPISSARRNVDRRSAGELPSRSLASGRVDWFIRNIDLLVISLIAIGILLVDPNQLLNPLVVIPLGLSLGIAVVRRRFAAGAANATQGAGTVNLIHAGVRKASPVLLGLLLCVAGFNSLYQSFSYNPSPEKWPEAFVSTSSELRIEDNYPRPSIDLVIDMSQTYGFWLGQNLYLDLVEEKYPGLRGEVFRVRHQFDQRFRDSIDKIAGIIGEGDGELATAIIQGNDAEIRKAANSSLVTREAALQALEEVDARAQGKIASPVLETLLMFHPTYGENPAQEYLDGFHTRYTADGPGKARGLKLSIEYPASWSAKDGERPHILKKFISNRKYSAMVLVSVNDLSSNPGDFSLSDLSKEETKELIDIAFQSGDLADALPLNAEPDAKGTRIRAKADSNSREKGQRFERKGTL